MEKQDFLRDCIQECGIPNLSLEAFQADFCNRPCYQPECTRSASGKSKFEQRALSWQDRLFRNPPQMSPQDPRYEQTRSKRFLEMAPSGGGGSNWVDPMNPQEPTQATQPIRPATDNAHLSAGSITLVPNDATPVLSNTPFQSGRMLGGRQIPASTSPPVVYDPWAAPTSKETDGIQVVKPGAKIKVGV